VEINGIAHVVRTVDACAAHLPLHEKRPIHRGPKPAREAASLPYRVGGRTSATARPERRPVPAEGGPKRDAS
jgi:hypothetical protein